MDKHPPKGAVIVADAKTAIYTASRPNFTQDNLATYLTAPMESLLIVDSFYDIGSIFKIVTTVAALNEGLISPDHEILCPGNIK